jgi:hypothetical protein
MQSCDLKVPREETPLEHVGVTGRITLKLILMKEDVNLTHFNSECRGTLVEKHCYAQ